MNIKKSIVIKEVDTVEVLRKPFNSKKDAISFCKEERGKLTPDEKINTKFKIKNI